MNGNTGTNGTNGANGTNGNTGLTGATGIAGVTGATGGSPVFNLLDSTVLSGSSVSYTNLSGYHFFKVVISNASVYTTSSSIVLNAELGYYNGTSVTWSPQNYYWNTLSSFNSATFLSNVLSSYSYGVNIIFANGNSGTYTISGETNIKNHNNNIIFAGTYNLNNSYRASNYISLSTGQISSIPAFNSIYLFLGNTTFSYFPKFSGGTIYLYGTNQPN